MTRCKKGKSSCAHCIWNYLKYFFFGYDQLKKIKAVPTSWNQTLILVVNNFEHQKTTAMYLWMANDLVYWRKSCIRKNLELESKSINGSPQRTFLGFLWCPIFPDVTFPPIKDYSFMIQLLVIFGVQKFWTTLGSGCSWGSLWFHKCLSACIIWLFWIFQICRHK